MKHKETPHLKLYQQIKINSNTLKFGDKYKISLVSEKKNSVKICINSFSEKFSLQV